jgi:hypothetical protein
MYDEFSAELYDYKGRYLGRWLLGELPQSSATPPLKACVWINCHRSAGNRTFRRIQYNAEILYPCRHRMNGHIRR